MSKTILFTGGTLPEEYQKKLSEMGLSVRSEPRADLSEDELISALAGVNAYILGGEEKATSSVLKKAKDLEIVAFFGQGYENYVDLKSATENGIAVSNTPKANSRSVAEFAMGLILSSLKRIPYLVNQTMQGKGQTYQTWNLQGGTIGIIGMGAVGSELAFIAHNGFGMQVLYTSRTSKPSIDAALSAKKVEIDELLQLSDVVSLHVPYIPETKDMIGARELSLMKKNAILINTGRAELVNPKALKQALDDHKIWGAASDVYYKEPVPEPTADEYGLVSYSKEFMLLTPHTAFKTRDAVDLMIQMNINSILSVFSGTPDENVLNPEYKKHR